MNPEMISNPATATGHLLPLLSWQSDLKAHRKLLTENLYDRWPGLKTGKRHPVPTAKSGHKSC